MNNDYFVSDTEKMAKTTNFESQVQNINKNKTSPILATNKHQTACKA